MDQHRVTSRFSEPSPIMDNRELAKLLIERSYLKAPPGKPFVLASGDTSEFYFDCQRTTTCAAAIPLVGAAFLRKFDELGLRPSSVGGLVLGADPIAMAIASASTSGQRHQIDAFRIRKDKKQHGTKNWLEGCAVRGKPVVVVDDVVTRGTSVVQAIKTCLDEGLEVLGCVVLVDRQQNGMDRIAQVLRGAPAEAIFTWESLKPLIAQK